MTGQVLEQPQANGKDLGKRGMRYYVYFKRGHATYLAMLVGLGSTAGIWYSLLGFNLFFESIITFAMLFVPVYVITCTILGWQDFKRGIYRREVEVQKQENVITIEILTTLRDLSKRLARVEEALGIKEEED